MNWLQRSQWHPTPVILPGKSHGRRSLGGCSPWGREESDTTEWLHFHFSLSCIGEGNGNPLQCSCLENPRDGEAWWAAVYGVSQSRTRLKRLSSSPAKCLTTGRMQPGICAVNMPLSLQVLPGWKLQQFPPPLTNHSHLSSPSQLKMKQEALQLHPHPILLF